jgi:hypothetical protein
MDQDELIEQAADPSDATTPVPVLVPSADNGSTGVSAPLPPANPDGSGLTAYPFVYALGRIEPRFPSLGVEKEFAQVVGRAETTGLTDRAVLQRVLAERANRYLARQICWVFTIEGLETYVLQPRDPADLDLLVEAIRATPTTSDVDVLIGVRGPIAPAEACNGLMIPLVAFDQIYSFDREALIAAIPRPQSIPEKEEASFRAAAGELFDRIMQMTDNAGAMDEDRAVNYLALRYPAIYSRAAEAYAGNSSLSGVGVQPSRLSGVRKIVEVIFSYTNRQTDVTDKYFVRVDVTEEFPFLVTRLAPYLEW